MIGILPKVFGSGAFGIDPDGRWGYRRRLCIWVRWRVGGLDLEKGFGFIMREREGGKFEMAGKVREGVISGDRFTTIEGRRTRNRRNGRRRRRRRSVAGKA